MDFIWVLSFLISIILMPFLCKGQCFKSRFLYVILCSFLTPLIGYPIYARYVKH